MFTLGSSPGRSLENRVISISERSPDDVEVARVASDDYFTFDGPATIAEQAFTLHLNPRSNFLL